MSKRVKQQITEKGFRKGVYDIKDNKYKLLHIEYCPNGHQNNLLLNGVQLPDDTILTRTSENCPDPECEYHVPSNP